MRKGIAILWEGSGHIVGRKGSGHIMGEKGSSHIMGGEVILAPFHFYFRDLFLAL